MTAPLAGIRVVDLTQYVAGPYCTQVLADLGAEVLKIERPGSGDVYRGQGPVFVEGESASFLSLNRGKRSLEVDLNDADDLAALKDLVRQADVVVENGRPGALARFRLDYASARALNPRLVYCSISAFGDVGPDAGRGGYDLTVQALTGLLSMTGHVGQPPAKIPIAALDFGSGVYGALGIVAALRVRDATGEAQHVQTSLFETALAWLSMHILTYRLGGEAPAPAGTRSAFFAPYEAYRTADGYVAVVGTGGKDAWGTFCRATGLDALRDDPSFATNSDRVANAEALRAEIEAMLMREPSAHWVRVLEDNGITCAPVRTLPDVLASEQARALGVVAELEHPVAGAVPTVRLPIRLSSSETTSSEPPPLLGADNALLRAPQQV